MQLIIDERADAAQRAALIRIMSGEDTKEGATMGWVFSAMCSTRLRVRIELPGGFEYRIAEIGSGRTKATGEIELNLKDTYAQFANIHLSDQGVVEEAIV